MTSNSTDIRDEAPPPPNLTGQGSPSRAAWIAVGLALVVGLTALTSWLVVAVPAATKGTGFGQVAKSIEFPVYAIALGLLANAVLSATRLRDRMSPAFRTEFFIKTGLVLLGASINFAVILRAAGPAIAQALLLITGVFFFTWWLAGRLGVDDRLRALLASAVSICGVSAAINAAGSVRAKKEQLAYTASLVILFALPSIFLLPWAADLLGLSPAVAGAWIGGNIDTTAAVTAAGTIAGEGPLQIATIVKVTQNALLGVLAVLLTAYFAFRVERATQSSRPSLAALWQRFPKFVLGFLVASIVVTVYSQLAPAADAKVALDITKVLREWFLTAAFISIGLELKVGSLREAGWKPVAAFSAATVFNLLLGLALASLLFASVTV